MKVALVYDRVNKWGGAESVLLALNKIFPEAPLFTSVYDSQRASWAKVFKVHPSFLQKLPLPKDSHENYPFLMGPAFESFNFDDFDVVISVTAEFAKAIITKPKTLHLCYCLNPTSYLWSGYDQYFSQKSRLFKALTRPVIAHLRWYDRLVSTRPDHYIAISETVRGRIKKYYHQEASVIFPPTTLGEFKKNKRGNSYLVLSRLVPNKRVDLAIAAFNQLGLPLKVVGTGLAEERLKTLAGPNIEFLGFVTEKEKWQHLAEAKALIIPGEEDFGLTAVEAQSVGTPVIAFGRGGVSETVLGGETGFLFENQSVAAIVETVTKASLSNIRPEACRKNAEKFSTMAFEKSFLATTERLWHNWIQKHGL